MRTRSWFEYEYRMPPPYGAPGWRRSRFSYRPAVFGTDQDPGGDEEALAHEMLIVLALRYRPGTRFRLVRVNEEVFDDEDREVVSQGGG